jgi:tRNA (guanine-N7-)-methyltransferase
MKQANVLKYEFNPKSLNFFPVNWKDVFGREAPIAIELGCGNGEFLVFWAQKHPDWNFIGIDLSLASCERSQIRIYQNGLSHIRIIRDDARFVLRELFGDNRIKQICINFPDPWPKEKHKNRRVIVPSFVDTLSSILENDGIFELVTDQKWYIVETRELF